MNKNDIFTSLLAARDYVNGQQLKPHLMLEDSALEDFADTIKQSSDNSQGNLRTLFQLFANILFK